MSGLFYGAPVDSLAEREAGLDIVPTVTGEVLGATAGQAWHDNLGVSALRVGDREYRQGVTLDAFGVPIQTPDRNVPNLTADEANAKFKLPGMRPFTAPVAEDVAADIYEDFRQKMIRENTVARRQTSIGTGMAAQFVTSALVSLADPLNVAAAFIPVVPEAKVAAWLASQTSGVGRAAVRAGVGAATGAVGMAALEPFAYARDIAEHNDWTMGGAALNVALGAAMGGVLHPLVGRFSAEERALRERVASLPPETREAASRASVAAVLEDRPVAAAQLVESAEAARAAGELRQWVDQTERLMRDTDAAIDATTTRPIPLTDEARARSGLQSLRDETERLKLEIRDIHERAYQEVAPRVLYGLLDDVSRARVERIDAELTFASALPRTRRAALEQERTMILEGQPGLRERAIAASGDNLEVQRTLAEAQGLRGELDRLVSQQRRAEVGLNAVETANAERRAANLANEAAGNRAWQIDEARISSRAEVLQSLAERTLRRYAAGQGAPLAPEDASRLAVRVLTAENPQAEIRAVLAELDRQAGVPYAVADRPVNVDAATQAMDGIAQSAKQAMLDATHAPNPQAEVRAQEIRALQERAPESTGPADEQIARLAEDQKRYDAILDAERQAERLKPEDEALIAAAAERAALMEGDAKAMEAASFCAAMRG